MTRIPPRRLQTVPGPVAVGRLRARPTPGGVVLAVGALLLARPALASHDRLPTGVMIVLVVLAVLDGVLAAIRLGAPTVQLTAPTVATTGRPLATTVGVTEPAGHAVRVVMTSVVDQPGVTIVAPGERVVWSRAPGLGVHRFVLATVSVTGPLGLAAAVRHVSVRLAEPVHAVPPGVEQAAAVVADLEATRRGATSQDQPSGLRERRSGEPLRDVHWPTSARTGRLVVRQSDAVDPAPVDVLVAPSGDRTEALRQAAGVARGAVEAVLQSGRVVRLHLRRGGDVVAPEETLDPDRRTVRVRDAGDAPLGQAVVLTVADPRAATCALAGLVAGPVPRPPGPHIACDRRARWAHDGAPSDELGDRREADR